MDQQSFRLSLAAQHHIQSFNYAISEGLDKVLTHFVPMEVHQRDAAVELPSNRQGALPFQSLQITYSQLRIGRPYRAQDPNALIQEVYPAECRMASKTYTAPLIA